MLEQLLAALTEEQLLEWLEQYRSFGPIPGLLLPFLKSFVPPLPTIGIIGWNAVVYGLWLGFLYSWIGLIAGSILTFLIIRSIAGRPFVERWTRRSKIARTMEWIRANGFLCVFLLSLLPVGPFVVINTAAGLARMHIRSFALAIALGRGVMIFTVSYIGHDPYRYVEQPWRLVFVILLIALSVILGKRMEAFFARKAGRESQSA